MISLKQKHKGFFERKKRHYFLTSCLHLALNYTQNNAKKELLKS